MNKHCRACENDHPTCKCLTCKRDSLYEVACCGGTNCPVTVCGEYEQEEVTTDA
jgi:hypothetical protein